MPRTTFGWVLAGVVLGLAINAFVNWPSQAQMGGKGK